MYSLDSHDLRAEGAEDSAVLVVLVGRKVWEHRSQRGQVLLVELVNAAGSSSGCSLDASDAA